MKAGNKVSWLGSLHEPCAEYFLRALDLSFSRHTLPLRGSAARAKNEAQETQ